MNSSGEGTSQDAAIPAGDFSSRVFIKNFRKDPEVNLSEKVR